ncbi:RNA methyltransferase [Candidatus Woesearchaeota archaeon]|nr:RNA methyltransferase [Candidatus Woesearchaeota archaeon]
MINVILVMSENSANIGSIARVMANFDLNTLILIAPKADHLSEEARSLAKHAQHILDNAEVHGYDYFRKIKKRFDYVIGTTSVLGTDYNLRRLPLTPEQAVQKIDFNKKIALVFGRDGSGLRNEELELCDFIVTIPASKKYPCLNISHSASIILYEVYKKRGASKVNEHIALASRREREIIMKKLNNILDKIDFATPEKKETQRLAWKNLFEKSVLTKREAFAVIGLLRKLERK